MKPRALSRLMKCSTTTIILILVLHRFDRTECHNKLPQPDACIVDEVKHIVTEFWTLETLNPVIYRVHENREERR